MFYIKNWEEYTYYLLLYLKEDRKGKFRSAFFQLHRKDQVRFFTQLDKVTRNYFYECVMPHEVALLFAKLSITKKKTIVNEVDPLYERALLHNVPSDEVARFLKRLTPNEQTYYLSRLPERKVEQIKLLLSYNDGTAGALMTTDFITARINETVEDVLNRLFTLGKYTDTIYYIYIVTESNKLIGVVSLRDLIVVPRRHTMKFMMKKRVVSVHLSTDEQRVVTIFKAYDLLLIPVVSHEEELLGIITIDDAMDITDRNKKVTIMNSILGKWSRSLMFTIAIIGLIVSILIS